MADPTDMERALDCATSLCNLALEPKNRAALVEQGGLDSIVMLANSPDLDTQWRCAAALRYLSSVSTNRFKLVERGAARALVHVASNPKAGLETLVHSSFALCNLSKSARARSTIVEQHAVPLLLSVSQTSTHVPTKQACATALANLSNSSSKIEKGSVSALIKMSSDTVKDAAAAAAKAAAGGAEAVGGGGGHGHHHHHHHHHVWGGPHDDLPPPPLAERHVEAPPTTQLPEIKVLMDHLEKAFVGGGGPPPPPVEPPVHLPIFFMGKPEGQETLQSL